MMRMTPEASGRRETCRPVAHGGNVRARQALGTMVCGAHSAIPGIGDGAHDAPCRDRGAVLSTVANCTRIDPERGRYRTVPADQQARHTARPRGITGRRLSAGLATFLTDVGQLRRADYNLL